MTTRFTIHRLNNQSFPEKNQDDERVIRELREKMNRLHFRLLDCQNQNQMLRKELLQAKKVINAEIASGSTENFKETLNQATTSDFRGRHQKITLLKNKLNELQNKIKELEEDNLDGSPEEPRKTKLDIRTDQKTTYSRKVMDKELQYLLKNSCHLKRKLEIWKKRNAELKKEAEILRLEHERLLEKSKEDQSVHESYSVVEKGLRARQSEKLAMRSRLDMEKTRNEKLVEELQMLKEELPMILSKINDDKMLIDAFNNQQGYLHDLLEHQKMIGENDNRRYRDDLRDIQTKHAMNNNIVSHLQDIVNDRKLECRELQQSMEHKKLIEDDENRQEPEKSPDTMANESDKSQIDEESSVSTIESHPQPDAEEPHEAEDEIAKLKENCEDYKYSFISWKEELESLSRNVLSYNERLNEWMTQLLQTRSQYFARNAEIRDLENTVKKLEGSLSSNNKKFVLSPFCAQLVDELETKNDILNEEHIFLMSLKELLMSTKENTLEVFLTYVDCLKKLFVDATDDLITHEQSNIKESEAEPEVDSVTLNGGLTASS